MQLDDQRSSDNVEDRRGMSGGGGGGMALGGGIGTIAIVLLGLYFGVDLSGMLGGGLGGGQPRPAARQLSTAQEDKLAVEVKKILGSTEDVWRVLMPEKLGMRYREPKLVLFTGSVNSACGMGQAAMGPFYCPGDMKVYIDLSFYNELEGKLQAPGDFPRAYVIAHEVGHHVQNLLGDSEKVHRKQQRLSKVAGNKLSVKLELQADYYAGVWAYHAKRRGIMEVGDYEEAIRAAGRIGDDTLQMQSQGYVRPDSFTHGSAAERIHWFRKGFESGDPRAFTPFEPGDLQ